MKLLNECDAESTGQCSLCRKSFLGIYPRLSGKWILSIEEETKLNQFTIFIFPISHAKPVVSFLETVPTRTNAHLSTSMLSSPIVWYLKTEGKSVLAPRFSRWLQTQDNIHFCYFYRFLLYPHRCSRPDKDIVDCTHSHVLARIYAVIVRSWWRWKSFID